LTLFSGSTFKRKANKKEREKDNPTYKDLDFVNMLPEGIFNLFNILSSLFKKIFRNKIGF